MKKQKVPVGERALMARINRVLAKETNPTVLKKAKGERAMEALGAYYTVDSGTFKHPHTALSQGVNRVNVNLEKFARELGVLKPWEEVADE